MIKNEFSGMCMVLWLVAVVVICTTNHYLPTDALSALNFVAVCLCSYAAYSMGRLLASE